MSLLNDALRAAEQRQGRQHVPAGYTGQATATHGGSGRGLWLIIVALVLLLLGAGWWLLSMQGSGAADSTTPVALPPAPAKAVKAGAESQLVVTEPAVEVVAPVPEAPEVPELREVREAPETPETPPAPAVTTEQPEPAPVAVVAPDSAPEPPAQTTAGVKQVRETPEVLDRRASRELDSMLRAGRWAEARQTLSNLTDTQDAPLSRQVVAKRLLIEGQAEQALDLLPDAVARSSAPLRLLRARALLATGDAERAVHTLQAQVPDVADNTEYHVTLATLLHQIGSSEDAARYWAGLIAWDDSRAPWWVGLAIALESGGQNGAARRAYEQAAALPGLPPSLADYVRQRLQSLRAG